MRASGVLMPVSSLPSRYGIGCFSKEAYEFVDCLERAGQSKWQVLPLGPTGYGDSPYQPFSTFAGNPYFIDLDTLVEEGLLYKEECERLQCGGDPRFVDYERIYFSRNEILRKAYERFSADEKFHAFCKKEQEWLEPYCLFRAIKDSQNGALWTTWPEELRKSGSKEVQNKKKELEKEMEYYQFLEYEFDRQWNKLKAYANKKGITIIGDLPIYVAIDSADAWANPKMFQMDEDGVPSAIAGCPPDAFSATGQMWGNPLYDWKVQKKTGYKWWIQRMKRSFVLYDTVRIDHFRGFESYYAIPYGNKTAEIGEWRKGPGMALFDAVKASLGDLSIIAEDLGFVTPEVRKLLKDSGYPGMKVLQFAFDDDPKSTYLPQNFETSNCIAYTGTHDNMTLRGWIHGSPSKTIAFAKRYLHCRSANDLPAAILRLTWSSTAKLAVAQMQDFLDAGPEGRMNTPSTTGGNWQYRTLTSDFNPRLAKRIYQLNELYNRLPEETAPKPLSKKRQKAAEKAAEKAAAVNESMKLKKKEKKS